MNVFHLHKYIPFLLSEAGKQEPNTSLFHVIPVPLEKSVSYGGGTAKGPSAILDASQQLEIYDGSGCPSLEGIFTHRALSCRGSIEKVLDKIAAATKEISADNKVPVLLGGEHTVTVGAVRGLVEAGKNFGVVQFDAHADLRDSYEGSRYSHACVMHRIHDLQVPFLQVGVRSLSPEEVDFRRENSICSIDAAEIYRKGIPEKILPRGFPSEIYVTFDVDGLDPSVISATGTPEPGGILWWQAMKMLEKISTEARIVGFDVVELAPRKKDHVSDFAAARLVYNLMGYVQLSRK